MTWSRPRTAGWRSKGSGCSRRPAASRATGGVPGDPSAALHQRRRMTEPTSANQIGRGLRLSATQVLMLRGLALFVASLLLVTTARALLDYSSRYQVPSDLVALIYDTALREGLDPDLAFRLVRVESAFDPKA